MVLLRDSRPHLHSLYQRTHPHTVNVRPFKDLMLRMQFRAQLHRLREVEMIEREKMVDANSTLSEQIFV